MPFPIRPWIATAGLCLCLTSAAHGEDWHYTVTTSFGEDRGQNYGSLFELRDQDGNVRGGAGFLGAYNTQPRSSRRTLHFFVKPHPLALYDGAANLEPDNLRREILSKPNTDAGAYLYEFKGGLLARSRGGQDEALRRWNTQSKSWDIDKKTPRFATEVGNGTLSLGGSEIFWNGQSIYHTDEGRLSLGEPYYANGTLFFREFWKEQNPWINAIIAVPWDPKTPEGLDLSKAKKLKLRSVNEFIYGWGQLGDKVIASTNTGGNYDFDGTSWRTLIEPDSNTSFQVYSILNYYDRLWMGQYPTGNIFEYDGNEMRLLKGQPPVAEPAVNSAREAQTLAIYRGDVYCGVWPWGEVWRFEGNEKKWHFVGRLFDHPEISAEFRHPYEARMKAMNAPVLNLWGQRVTSLVPFGDSLYAGTSAKNSKAWDPEYAFLSTGEKWKDYGQVHRLTLPGHLSVPINWTEEETTFEFEVSEGKIIVRQDGVELGRADVWIGSTPKSELEIETGFGIFGPWRGGRLMTTDF